MDKIKIKELEIYGFHGVNPEENRLGQRFLLSLTLYLDTYAAGISDDLHQTIHYGDVCHFVEEKFQEKQYQLIEACAEALVEQLLLKYPILQKVKLTLKKPWAPIGSPLQYAAVTITRGWHTAFLGLGANLGDRAQNLQAALASLSEPHTVVEAVSSFHETKPMGYLDQPDFLNCCCKIRTLLPPMHLLKHCQTIEQSLKRERTVRWGPRTIDLDILLYDALITDTDSLVLPHPRMTERLFVLEPLAEIAPNAIHPQLQERISSLADKLKKGNSSTR